MCTTGAALTLPCTGGVLFDLMYLFEIDHTLRILPRCFLSLINQASACCPERNICVCVSVPRLWDQCVFVYTDIIPTIDSLLCRKYIHIRKRIIYDFINCAALGAALGTTTWSIPHKINVQEVCVRTLFRTASWQTLPYSVQMLWSSDQAR